MIDKIGENYHSTVGDDDDDDVTSESDNSIDAETFSLRNSSITPDSESVRKEITISPMSGDATVNVIGKWI